MPPTTNNDEVPPPPPPPTTDEVGAPDVESNNNNDPTTLANAEHLDHLESSDQINDIASFQDIELPPMPKPPVSDDVESVITETGGDKTLPNSNSMPRRAKRFYYLRPIIIKYKYIIGGCIVMFILLCVAIGLSVNSVKKANSSVSSDNVDANDFIINDAPNNNNDNSGGFPESFGGTDGLVLDEDDEEEVGDPLENVPDEDTQPPRPDPSPSSSSNSQTGEEDDEEVGEPLENDFEELTQPPRGPSSSITPAPTWGGDDSEQLERPQYPKWYQTTHSVYQDYIQLHTELNANNMHSYDIAGLFCQSLDLVLCPLNVYCPNGQGSNPYSGGPPKPEEHSFNTFEQVQWAPFNTNSNIQENDWVQVGTMPESEDGNEDNNYGKCYEYDIWFNGIGGDIEDAWSAEHRRWMLCCEKDGNDV